MLAGGFVFFRSGVQTVRAVQEVLLVNRLQQLAHEGDDPGVPEV